MAWWNSKSENNETRTLSELSNEDRDALEAALMDGGSPAELAREFNVKLPSVYQLKRGLSRQFGTPQRVAAPAVSQNPDAQAIRQEIETLRLRNELERAHMDAEYQREVRALDLERKRLELEEKRRELFGDDEEDIIEQAQDNPEAMFWKVISKAMSGQMQRPPTPETAAPPLPAHVPPPPPVFDFGKDMSADDIRHLMQMRFSDAEIKSASLAPWPMVEAELKKSYPNITPTNINHVRQILAAYGN